MTSEPMGDRQSTTDPHSHGSRRRRHHKHPWHVALQPYRRQLKNFALFCAMVIISYFVWDMLAGK